MTSKPRENKNLAVSYVFLFLVVCNFLGEISRDEHTLVMLEEKIRMIKN